MIHRRLSAVHSNCLIISFVCDNCQNQISENLTYDDYYSSNALEGEISSKNKTIKCSKCGKEFNFSIISSERFTDINCFNLPDNYKAISIDYCWDLYLNNNFTQIDFENYLFNVLLKSDNFKNVKKEVMIPKTYIRADITVTSKDNKTWLIECKNNSTFTMENLQRIVLQIQRYMQVSKFDNYVLAFPGLLPDVQVDFLKKNSITIWDAKVLATQFSSEIASIAHPVFQAIFTSIKSTNASQEQEFINQLQICDKGKKSWQDYQKLVGKILEYLFCPPLENPLPQQRDKYNVNIRDFIFPNYADHGFWKSIKDRYNADYIIVDAKNCTDKISKKDVTQIANYMKAKGAGMFAIIVTRIGANKGALLTIEEQWIFNDKMILVLNDQDIVLMLLSKEAKGDPEKVIIELIKKFRIAI